MIRQLEYPNITLNKPAVPKWHNRTDLSTDHIRRMLADRSALVLPAVRPSDYDPKDEKRN